MHMLQHRLASVRRQSRLYVTLRGVGAVVAIAVGAATIFGLLDFRVHLPSLVRAYALVAVLGAMAYVGFRWLIIPFAKRNDDLSLAIQIEDAYPELNDVLASTVQFLEAENTPGSASMRAKAIDKAMDATADLDFGRILDRRGMLWSSLAMLAALAVGGYFSWIHQDLTEIALRRLLDPFGDATWTRIELDPAPPTRIAIGQPFPLRGQVDGILPPQLRIDIEMLNPGETKHAKEPVFEKRSEKMVTLKSDPKTPGARFVTGLDVTQLKGKFRFRITGNDGRFPASQSWHEVEVVPPPVFVDLDGRPSPQLTLFPPEYTDLPSPQPLSPGTKHLDMYLGTYVALRAAVDRPLSAAWIELEPHDIGVRVGPLANLLCQPAGLEGLTHIATQQAFSGRVMANLDDTRCVLSVAFQPWAGGNYVLHLVDAGGLPKDHRAEVRIKLDPVPFVQIQQPSSSRSVLPDATIAFKVLAEDEEFAVRSVRLQYQRVDGEDHPLEDAKSIVLYDPDGFRAALARMRPSLLPLPWVLPDAKARPKRLELERSWALNRRFKEGDVILIEGLAHDFCNIVTPRLPGRSPSIKLRIVAKSDLAKILDDGLGDAQRELVRLQKMQQDAIDMIKQIDKAKEPQQKLDRLTEAAELQKQIEERIGNRPDEGLRGDLAKLDQVIKDNKLPPTEMNEQVKDLLSELNRLSQEDMQKIEQSINEARKEITGAQKPMPNPKKQDGLDKTKQAQQQAKDALDELTRKLDKFADATQFKSDLREFIQEQQRIAKETDAARPEGAKKDPATNDKKTEPKTPQEVKDALRAQADAEKQLADKTEKLQERMEKALGRQAKDTKEFKDLGAKLKKTQRLEDDKDRANTLKELAKETRDLANKQDEDAKASLQQLAKDMEAAAKQMEKGAMNEEAQSEFQRKAQKAIKQAENETTPPQVKNLKEAVKVGQDNDIAGQMRKATEGISKELENKKKQPEPKNLDQVRENQDKALKNLKEQLAALEGEKDDGLDRLKKKQREAAKAEENVDQLAKKAKDAKNIKNGEEKAEELRNIAKEARDQARELQRLQEEKASKELRRAAQALEDAADKAQNGQPNEANDLEREAEKHIEQAKKDIEQFEEELAREQLAKIADRLKGLKERQDTAIERTNELQQKLQKTRTWSRGLQQSLDGDRTTQAGLAEETRSLQEKIKEAKVFEHVMEKAAKAMDRAAEAMAKRKDTAPDRPNPWKDEDAKDEQKRHDEIVKLQTQATDRLQRLLDALKDEPQVAQAPMEPMQPMEGGDEPQQRPRPPGDGIPPMAELKALRAEQLEVNEKTKEFALRHPNVDNLNEEQRRELTEIEAEQRRLREIFAGMTTEKKGAQP